MSIRTLLLVSAVLMLSIPARAQTKPYSHGSSAELKGITRVFVNTGDELEVRNNIVAELRKKLPQIVIADSAAAADVVLVFGASAESFASGVSHNAIMNSSSVEYSQVVTGTGYVVRELEDGQSRLLMQYEASRTTGQFWMARPSTRFARAFVKEFLAANKPD